MNLFFFDIETAGQYKNFEEFSINDERGANLFKNKYEKMHWSEKYSDLNDAYINNAGIISTFGKFSKSLSQDINFNPCIFYIILYS